MDAKKLLDLGFDTCGGQIDYKGKNYGFLTPDGAELTEEGRKLVAELSGGAPKKGRAKKAEQAEADAEQPVEGDAE